MIAYILFSILLLIGYAFLLFQIAKYWEKEDIKFDFDGTVAQPPVSIIIAGRNEELILDRCLTAIFSQSYPQDQIEVIFVNDGSIDGTLQIAEKYLPKGLILIDLKDGNGKKYALKKGIEASENDLLLFTDADSIVGENWISSMVSFQLSKGLDMVCGPICYYDEESLLSRFQVMDGMNNMAATMAGINSGKYYLANGANFMYTRSIYDQIGSFDSEYASGDDVFMVQQGARLGAEIGFNKCTDALVATANEESWSSLIEQRKRWASKTKGYPQKGLTYLQGSIWILVMWILCSLLAGLFLGNTVILIALLMLAGKWIIDYWYLKKLSRFFDNEVVLRSFIPLSFLYLMYIVYAGFQALLPGTYRWKGRDTH